MKAGRLTIPSDIRDIEHITEGDYVQISIEKIEESSSNDQQNKKENRLKERVEK